MASRCLTYRACCAGAAWNFDDGAVLDDFSCVAALRGCTDARAMNYERGANTDSGQVITSVQPPGCGGYTSSSPLLQCVYAESVRPCAHGPGPDREVTRPSPVA
jgi:hypothetical protein